MSSVIPRHLLQKVENDKYKIEVLRKKKLQLYLDMKKLREHSPQWQELSVEHKLVSKDLAEAQRIFDPMPWISADDEKGMWAAVDALEERNAKEAVPAKEAEPKVVNPVEYCRIPDELKALLLSGKLSEDMHVVPHSDSPDVSEVVFYLPFKSLKKWTQGQDELHIGKLCTQSRGKGWFLLEDGTGIACSFFQLYVNGKDESKKCPKLASNIAFLKSLSTVLDANYVEYMFFTQESTPSKRDSQLLEPLTWFSLNESHNNVPVSLYTAFIPAPAKEPKPEYYKVVKDKKRSKRQLNGPFFIQLERVQEKKTDNANNPEQVEPLNLASLGIPAEVAALITSKLDVDMEAFPHSDDVHLSEVMFFVPFSSFPNLSQHNAQLIANMKTQSRGKGWFIPEEKNGLAFSYFQRCDLIDEDALYTDPKQANACMYRQELQRVIGGEDIKYASWVQGIEAEYKKTRLLRTFCWSSPGSVRSHRIVPKSLYTAIDTTAKKAPQDN